jgi:two-component system, chemotaxis family, CheB/CheR fusion protein
MEKKSLVWGNLPFNQNPHPDVQQQALREIFTNLRVRTGHDFSIYKRATVLRRIERRISVHSLSDLPGYSQFLRDNAEEAQALLKDLLISVTNFFRDKESFEYLETEVLPELLKGKSSEDPLRIWVAGCATGEEAYSLAMICAEQTDGKTAAPTVQIFATDIDETAIAVAREGFYTLNDAADVSPERLRRFFINEGAGYRVRRELRDLILFAKHNVMKDPPFSRLDLATCRNLLIYINKTAQEKVMEVFHFALKPGGYLFLGSSESIDGAGDLFAPVNRERHFYQSRRATKGISYPVPDIASALRFAEKSQKAPAADGDKRNTALERVSFGELHQQLLEQYAPPSVVVNEEYDIVHLSERAGRFLQVAGGSPSKNLLKLIRPELRVELRAALFQAVRREANVEAKNLPVNFDNKTELVNIMVRPVLKASGDTARGFILVLFEPAGDAPLSLETIQINDEPIARQIEQELIRVKEQLRTSTEQFEIQTEELRASNEELQALNEELRSSIEELETSKEELQSVNEELTSVNQELKIKIEELSQSNNDFQNLMNSTDIGTIFLDRNLRVKLFTPPVSKIFNLLQTDLNRPLADITSKVNLDDLLLDVKQVLGTLQTVEREFEANQGEWFLMRIFPYRTNQDLINGVVISFIDISARRQAEKSIRFQAHLLDAIEQSVIATDLSGKVLYWNSYAHTLFGWSPAVVQGRNIMKLTTPDTSAAQAREIMRKLRKGESWSGEFQVQRRDGTTFPAHVINSPIEDGEGNLIGVVGVSIDVTERNKAEAARRETEDNLRLIIESVTDYAIFTQTEDKKIATWNIGAEKVFGWKEEEILGRDSSVLFTPEDREAGVPEQERDTAAKKGRAEDERWHIRKNGERFYASGVMSRLRDGKGYVKVARDMTDKLVAEKVLRAREMLQRMVGAQEDERKRIARDLHDQLGQQMTALKLNLEIAGKKCGEEEIRARIDEAQILAKHASDSIDFLAWELRPAALDDFGLLAALEVYVREWTRHSGATAEFYTVGWKKARLAPETETNLYRIAQEALNNVLKHAKAKKVNVIIEKRGDWIILIVEDDGVGFNVVNKSKHRKGIGLTGMSERAALIGGTLEIESAKRKGTTIIARVPAKLTGAADRQ